MKFQKWVAYKDTLDFHVGHLMKVIYSNAVLCVCIFMFLYMCASVYGVTLFS